MATLAQLSDRARRKMGLGLGDHTVTVTQASAVAGDTITVHGIILTVFTAANPSTELASFKSETSDNATATNLKDVIGGVFDGTTGVTATVSTNKVTITGARSVVTSKTAAFSISSSTYQDEPPYTSDFDQWVLDGELDVADKSTNASLMAGKTGLMDVITLADSSGTAIAIAKPTNLLRPIEVRAQIGSDAALYRLMLIPPAIMLQVRQNTHEYYKVDSADKAQKYWSMWDDKIQFSSAPVTGSGKSEVIGIKTPQTTKATESELPNHLQPLVSDYVVVQAYTQMQRLDIAQHMFQRYIANLGATNKQYRG